MTMRVGWGNGAGAAEVTGSADLDAVLDTIQPGGLPYCVSVVVPDDEVDFPVLLEICVGHPDRSFVYHVGADGSSAWGYEPDLEPIAPFDFDYCGQFTETWPERTQVTLATARAAAREFVTTGGCRPTCLSWHIHGF
jgi:hypothetical protein